MLFIFPESLEPLYGVYHCLYPLQGRLPLFLPPPGDHTGSEEIALRVFIITACTLEILLFCAPGKEYKINVLNGDTGSGNILRVSQLPHQCMDSQPVAL